MPDPRPIWKRPPIVAASSILVIAGLAIAVWLVRPLFVDKVVDEAFPIATDAASEPETAVAIEPAPRDTSASSEETDAPAPTEAAGPVVVLTGSFEGADDAHPGSGNATIYRLSSGRDVLRFETFDVTNGPDLHVLLVPIANPQSSGDVHTEGYVDLGKLKGNQGDQNYDLPSSVDLSSGEWSVVIYCDPFSVIFATASLTG